MLSFLLKQIWIGIDDFLLNFFATFASVLGLQITVTLASVLGLQVTVGLQINTGLQPLTRWEPFVAGIMLRRPEPTKERVEPTILSIIAIEITHLTSFAFHLLPRILRICGVITSSYGLRPAMSNLNGLLSRKLCHYLNQGRIMNDILLKAAH